MLLQYTLSDLQKRASNIKTALRKATGHPFKPTQCQSLLAMLYREKNWQTITGNLKKSQPLEIEITLPTLEECISTLAGWLRTSGAPINEGLFKKLVSLVLPRAFGFKDMLTLFETLQGEGGKKARPRKHYRNPGEHMLEGVSLAQFEQNVPAFAKMTIDECRGICDFLGVELAHIALLDDEFEVKLDQLYASRGLSDAEDHMSWNGGVVIAGSNSGQKHIVWQRSFFDKYLGPGVFFFNLGSAMDLVLSGAEGKYEHNMLIGKLVGTVLSFDHSKAVASVMGVVTHAALFKAGLVRKDVQKEMMQQVQSDCAQGSLFSREAFSIANRYLARTELSEKISPEDVINYLGKELETLREELLDIALDNVDYDNDVMNKIINELNMVMGGISKNERKQFKRDFVESVRRREDFSSIFEMIGDDFPFSR